MTRHGQKLNEPVPDCSSFGTLARAVVWQAVGERESTVGSEREARLWRFGGVSVSVVCSGTSWLAQMCSTLVVVSKWVTGCTHCSVPRILRKDLVNDVPTFFSYDKIITCSKTSSL